VSTFHAFPFAREWWLEPMPCPPDEAIERIASNNSHPSSLAYFSSTRSLSAARKASIVERGLKSARHIDGSYPSLWRDLESGEELRSRQKPCLARMTGKNGKPQGVWE
jgi:hypothetical protein